MRRNHVLRFFVLTLSLSLLLLGGCAQLAPKKTVFEVDAQGLPQSLNIQSLPLISVDMAVMLAEQNPREAKQRFRSQWIKLRGQVVDAPVPDRRGVPTYTFMLRHADKRIACAFTGAIHEPAVMVLQPGQTVTIIGQMTCYDFYEQGVYTAVPFFIPRALFSVEEEGKPAP